MPSSACRTTEYSSKKTEETSSDMAVTFRKGWFDRELFPRHRDSMWARDDWLSDIRDWPTDWPAPRDIFGKFLHNRDSWWNDWPTAWPKMDAVMPRLNQHLDRMDSNWRRDPFWQDVYPVWAEPIFKEGIDVNSHIINDERKFAVSIDAYQFRPEEIQVKTLDDTLLVEGRHEEVRDRDNYTKMYFVRKYQLPTDVSALDIVSNIDSRGRLTVEAAKHASAIQSRERMIPIEGSKYRPPIQSNAARTRYDSGYSQGYSSGAHSQNSLSPLQVDAGAGRNIRIEQTHSRSSSRGDYRGEARGAEYGSRAESRGEYRGDSRNDFRSGHAGEQVLERDRNELGVDGRNGGFQSSEYHYRSESRSGGAGGLSPHQVTTGNEGRQYTNGQTGRRASFESNGFRSHSRGAEARSAAHHESSSYAGGSSAAQQYGSESRNALATSGASAQASSAQRSAHYSASSSSHTEQNMGVLPQWTTKNPLH